MQLSLSSQEAEFRARVRSWLRSNVPPGRLAPVDTERGLRERLAWERTLLEAGFAAVHWPAEYGGAGADVVLQSIFQEEYTLAGAPERLNRMGLGLIGPTLIALGTPAQKARWLPPILSCEEIWCQGFSESEAGSDLASLRSTGVVDGDRLVINGSKIWTSLATYAHWMFALVRTDAAVAKHRGLTFVLVPLNAPGVEVRPVRQLHGELGFAEVFLDDVPVPLDHVVGGVDDGWRVALAALDFERSNGLADHARFSRSVDGLVALARRAGTADDDAVRDLVADCFVDSQVYRRYVQHTLTRTADAPVSAAEPNMTKTFWSELDARIHEAALTIAGEHAELLPEAEEAMTLPNFHRHYWHSRASRIFAGANEIQRNVIAERGLGLPRE